MSKLSAYEVWKKKKIENLNDEQFKQLLIENDILVPKIEPSEELITMLTSFVQFNSEESALEVFNLCKREILEKLNFKI